MTKNFLAPFVLVLLGLALAACGGQQQGPSSYSVWVDTPLNGSVLLPGDHQIVIHISSAEEITYVDVTINAVPAFGYGC